MNEHILVIDDDELVRTGLATNLERAGFRVTMAACGEEGLAAAGRERIDLALCDLVLGDLDGIEVLRRLKTQSTDTCVIMITGHGSVHNALDALRSGASDYLQKPADPDEVVHRIRTVLDGVRLRHTLSAERERAEARKRETGVQLVRAERMSSLGMLAEGAAHDLSNILGPVLQYPALIREALPPDSPALKLVQAIEEAGQKSAAVLQDLQTIGRGGQYEKSSVNVNHVVDRFMRSHDFERLKQHYPKVRAELQMAAALPTIVGSELQLQQLLSNLVSHAFEAMPGGGMITIETGSGRLDRPVGRYGSGAPGEYVVLKVSDTGSGLAPEDVERIFEPFYVRSVMGRHMLSGLSMTLVYRVVADHHGFIDVTTATGKGTTFVVYLPVAAADGTLELKPDYTGHETVLVVDDYEEHRDAATELLRDLGYRALTARNGRDAVAVLEASLRGETDRIDLVVLDLVLGDDFDGVETYKKIIELQPGQKTVMVSGFADIARIVEARKLGLRQCIQKPYTLDGLGKAVRSELDAV